MSGIKTTRRLMETRTQPGPEGDSAGSQPKHQGPEELEPGLLLAPGMVAKDVLEVVKTTETNPGKSIQLMSLCNIMEGTSSRSSIIGNFSSL